MQKQKQCKFPPVINIHASAWVRKDIKEYKGTEGYKALECREKKKKEEERKNEKNQHTSYPEMKAREITQ